MTRRLPLLLPFSSTYVTSVAWFRFAVFLLNNSGNFERERFFFLFSYPTTTSEIRWLEIWAKNYKHDSSYFVRMKRKQHESPSTDLLVYCCPRNRVGQEVERNKHWRSRLPFSTHVLTYHVHALDDFVFFKIILELGNRRFLNIDAFLSLYLLCSHDDFKVILEISFILLLLKFFFSLSLFSREFLKIKGRFFLM